MLTMVDLFCGAGGSTTGAAMVPGVQVQVAVNHWPRAVRTHQLNHPGVEHKVADISQLAPTALPFADLLWASPSCVGHSAAQPARESQEAARSRATAFDVIRFLEHWVDRGRPASAAVVENVPEFVTWRFFGQWSAMLGSLGYRMRLVHMNSTAANLLGPSAGQLRDRLYVVAWRDGAPQPDFDSLLSPRAQCPDCGPVRARQSFHVPVEASTFRGVAGASAGRYRFQYVFVCPQCARQVAPDSPVARDVVDLSDRGPLVRGRDLAPSTLRRIRAGVAKVGGEDPVDGVRGFMARNNGSSGDGGEHCTSLHSPLRTVTTKGHQSLVTFTGTGSPAQLAARARMRFLRPAEAAAAFGFPSGYQVTGSAAEQMKQIGNAVTPPAARDLVACVTASITGAGILPAV